MSISIKTRKMLWGRSANRCNFENCRRELVMDATETDDESIIGEECHIIARENDGPRGTSDLSEEQRDKYSNLILLCNIHHKVIDDQPKEYSVEKLRNLKTSHENWVRNTLSYDSQKQHDDEIYSMYIEEWCKMVDIDNWQGWTSFLLGSGQPSTTVEMDQKLHHLKEWILSRVWPKRYEYLELAFENFRRVLESLYRVFHEHSEEKSGVLRVEKFYKIDRWDEKLYSKLHKEFEFTVYLVEDLVMELTRAANYICDRVREYILPSFRIKEGLLLVTYGPCSDFSFKTVRTEYRGDERTKIPYPGLEEFKIIRETRDFHFNEGVSPEDPKFLKCYHNDY